MNVLRDNPPKPDTQPTPQNSLNGRYIPEAKLVNGVMDPVQVTGSIIFPGKLVSEAVVTDAAVARAAGLLSLAQIATLRDLQAAQAARLLLAPEEKLQATMEQAQDFYQKMQPVH